MTTNDPRTFREQLGDALVDYRARTAQEEAKNLAARTERTRLDFVEQFGIEPDSVSDRQVIVDGITLQREYRGYKTWAVVGKCPNCGQDCVSSERRDLADIAIFVETFVPDYDHIIRCPGKPRAATEETTAERLLAALKDFIAETQGGAA